MKKEKEENIEVNSVIDTDELMEDIPLQEVKMNKSTKYPTKKISEVQTEDNLVNCLRNERVIIRYIPRTQGIWGDNPKHVLAGGMAENATRVFVVPRLSSGTYVNILTDKEKEYLENIMGLENNTLSIYRKVDNFWDDTNSDGINQVRLTKQDNYLNLADPEDYIKYKILLANKDYIAPSLQALEDYPKATYQFVIVEESDETKMAKTNMSTTMRCYVEFGKIEDDIDTLRQIVETMDGRPTSPKVKLDFLQTKANDLIQHNSKLFLKVITDEYLPTKVLIKKSVEAGNIIVRNSLYYLHDGSPLCEYGEDSTITNAAKYINSPKHQETKFKLEAKLK